MATRTRGTLRQTLLALLPALALSAPVLASSHREAPAISNDPSADNTDVYFFRDPIDPSRLVMIANWIPLEEPAGGPNFFHFEPNIRYEFNVDSDGDAHEDWVYRVEFTRNVRNGATFLQNTGPVTSLDDAAQNVYYTYSVKKCLGPSPNQNGCVVIGNDLIEAPNNVGPKSFPNGYGSGSGIAASVYPIDDDTIVFAGPRAEGFYVDLGMIFDLINFRPDTLPGDHGGGVNTTAGYNVHAIAHLGSDPEPDRQPHGPDGDVRSQRHRQHVVLDLAPADDDLERRRHLGRHRGLDPGLAPRQPADQRGRDSAVRQGPFQRDPSGRRPAPTSAPTCSTRSWPASSRCSSASTFRRRRAPTCWRSSRASRASRCVPVRSISDQLRLNVAVFPTPVYAVNRLGVLAGDNAGFPNGRRPYDDTVDIALRVVAGVLVPDFNVAPNNALGDGVDGPDRPFIAGFPFLFTPHSGYSRVHDDVPVITQFSTAPDGK